MLVAPGRGAGGHDGSKYCSFLWRCLEVTPSSSHMEAAEAGESQGWP